MIFVRIKKTLKCLIIICCFLPAEFWQKYAEVSEPTGHVRSSGKYGTIPHFLDQSKNEDNFFDIWGLKRIKKTDEVKKFMRNEWI